MAVSSPLLETSINGAMGILINITGSPDIGLEEIEQAAGLVQSAVHPDALTIFGATFDETLDDEIRVTVIATGFDQKNNAAKAAEGKQEGAASHSSSDIRSEFERMMGDSLFSGPVGVSDDAKKEEPEEDDPFADIMKIFDNK